MEQWLKTNFRVNTFLIIFDLLGKLRFNVPTFFYSEGDVFLLFLALFIPTPVQSARKYSQNKQNIIAIRWHSLILISRKEDIIKNLKSSSQMCRTLQI